MRLLFLRIVVDLDFYSYYQFLICFGYQLTNLNGQVF